MLTPPLATSAADPPRLRNGTASKLTSYLLIPDKLIADHQNNRIALGLYALIARRYVIAKAPIPLSAADAQRYDPTLTRGAAVRALGRLVLSGWLIETAQPGHKSCYVPTWGVIAGSPRPWRCDEARLGRPRHVHALRLDARLLDLCLGRLEPHALHPAQITRYVTRPLLSLADVGAYACALARRAVSSPALTRLGLIRDGRPCPLPEDATILALASQEPLFSTAGTALTEQGLRRLGVTLDEPVHGRPLFFVPPQVIGESISESIGRVIGLTDDPAAGADAAARAAGALDGAQAASAWTHGTGCDHGACHPPSPLEQHAKGGGHTRQHQHDARPERMRPSQERGARSEPAEASETETSRLLRALGVRPRVADELADIPPELARAAIASGRARAGVRDLAGWVVAMLRDVRDRGWTIPGTAPANTGAHPPLPPELKALDVAAYIAGVENAAPGAVPLEADTTCACDGSGYYLLDVPFGHPLHGKVQRCPCQHRERVRGYLEQAAGPELAAAELAAVRVDDRPYDTVTWSGHAFTPAEQARLLSYALARCAAMAGAAPARGATLLGPPGSGKTTIAVATAKEIAARRGLALRYTSVPQLLAELRQEATEHRPATLLQALVDAPVLVLDDLGREKLTPWAREQLYRLLDERARQHSEETPRVTFMTSNLAFAELYALDGALASRIAAHTDVLLCVASDYRLHASSCPDHHGGVR